MTVRVLLEPPAKRAPKPSSPVLKWARRSLLFGGLAALAFSAYVYVDAGVYQRYQDWSFDRAWAGKEAGVGAFLHEEVLGGDATIQPTANVAKPPGREASILGASPVFDASVIGRIEIPRLRVHAIVKEGVDERTLRRAVGHVPETVLPGVQGNVGLAGHRDSFFRGLKDVRRNDRIVMETHDTRYEYEVESFRIVGPDDVDVLAPTHDSVLTLVTCYPFHYVGNAPRRFIVRARQVSVEARESLTPNNRTGS